MLRSTSDKLKRYAVDEDVIAPKRPVVAFSGSISLPPSLSVSKDIPSLSHTESNSGSDSDTPASTSEVSVNIPENVDNIALNSFDLMKKNQLEKTPVTSFKTTLEGSQFDVKQYLASGSFVDVYKATSNGVETVIKVLKPAYRDDETYRRKLKRDSIYSKHFSHKDDREAFKIQGPMASHLFISGDKLFDVKIKSVESFFKIFHAVIKALQQFHQHKDKYVHLDLSDTNVIMNGEDSAVLIDLADIRKAGEYTSPTHAASHRPEELQNSLPAHTGSDIFSLAHMMLKLSIKNNLKIPGLKELCDLMQKQDPAERLTIEQVKQQWIELEIAPQVSKIFKDAKNSLTEALKVIKVQFAADNIKQGLACKALNNLYRQNHLENNPPCCGLFASSYYKEIEFSKAIDTNFHNQKVITSLSQEIKNAGHKKLLAIIESILSVKSRIVLCAPKNLSII